MTSILVPPVSRSQRAGMSETLLRDRREVSFPQFAARTISTVLADADHKRIAKRHGGTPITYVAADGKERAAIRLPDGEILLDYRSDLTYLMDVLAASLRV